MRWDGLSFPEQVLATTPIATTYESTLSFTRRSLAGAPASISGGVPDVLADLHHNWAAVVSAELCTASPAVLQHLDLQATPGTELLINGHLVARTRQHAVSSSNFPRGLESSTPFVRWVSRGCDTIQLRLFEPPSCPAGHVEPLLQTLEQPAPTLQELRIAHSNTSVVLCGTIDCSRTNTYPLSGDMQQLLLHVNWRGDELRQGVGYVDAAGNYYPPEDWVRPIGLSKLGHTESRYSKLCT